MVRYSFVVEDFHLLHPAGLPGAIWQGQARVSANEGKAVEGVPVRVFGGSRMPRDASKAFTQQLKTAEDYHELRGVVGVTICDFCLWPDRPEPGSFTLPIGGAKSGETIPMLSRWRRVFPPRSPQGDGKEQHTGLPGLSQVQYVFLELPKYKAGPHPTALVDKWALFFREAENFDVIPPELDEDPFREALEIARTAQLSEAEYEESVTTRRRQS